MKKKEKELWRAAAWDMLYLAQCGINSFVPDAARAAKMDLEKVYVLSKRQSLEALTYMALEKLIKENLLTDENKVLKCWEESKNKAIRKTMLMDAERAKLFSYLEAKGIWHVALKGAVLCHMYPEYGMRQMSDNDILFDASFRQEVYDWFVEQGYIVESFQKSNHDEYLKKPIYNFEMHTALFYKGVYPQFEKHYLTLRDRLLPVQGKSFEYYMKDEDFYIYILAHVYKHYCNNGTGIRSLIDLYIWNRQFNSLNQNYLDNELETMGLFNFEKEMKTLSEKVFSPMFNSRMISKKQRALLEELLFSRTYGSKKDFWNSKVRDAQRKGKRLSVGIKARYLLYRIYPGKAYMEMWSQRYAPCFLQHRWLMPIVVVLRVVKMSEDTKKIVKKEIEMVRKA